MRDVGIFIGEDGSMGFRRGQKYRLTIDYDRERDWIVLWSGRCWCPYSNISALLQNWQFELEKKNDVKENWLNGFVKIKGR